MPRLSVHGAFPKILVIGGGAAIRRVLALLVHGFRRLLAGTGSPRSPRLRTTKFIVLGAIWSLWVTGLVECRVCRFHLPASWLN
jgi:hypothetical protein